MVIGVIALVSWWAHLSHSHAPAPVPAPSTPSEMAVPDWWEASIRDLDAHARNMPGYAEVRATDPPTLPAAKLRQAAQLFYQYCAACHGDGGYGYGPAAAAITTGPPTNLHKSEAYKRGTHEHAIFRTAKWGIPGTGSAPIGATDHELWVIAGYVRNLQDPPTRQHQRGLTGPSRSEGSPSR